MPLAPLRAAPAALAVGEKLDLSADFEVGGACRRTADPGRCAGHRAYPLVDPDRDRQGEVDGFGDRFCARKHRARVASGAGADVSRPDRVAAAAGRRDELHVLVDREVESAGARAVDPGRRTHHRAVRDPDGDASHRVGKGHRDSGSRSNRAGEARRRKLRCLTTSAGWRRDPDGRSTSGSFPVRWSRCSRRGTSPRQGCCPRFRYRCVNTVRGITSKATSTAAAAVTVHVKLPLAQLMPSPDHVGF